MLERAAFSLAWATQLFASKRIWPVSVKFWKAAIRSFDPTTSFMALSVVVIMMVESLITPINGSLYPCAHQIHPHAKFASVVPGYNQVDLLAAKHAFKDSWRIVDLAVVGGDIFLYARHIQGECISKGN